MIVLRMNVFVEVSSVDEAKALVRDVECFADAVGVIGRRCAVKSECFETSAIEERAPVDPNAN